MTQIAETMSKRSHSHDSGSGSSAKQPKHVDSGECLIHCDLYTNCLHNSVEPEFQAEPDPSNIEPEPQFIVPIDEPMGGQPDPTNQVGSGPQTEDKEDFRCAVKWLDGDTNRKFKTTRFNLKIEFKMEFDKSFNVQHFEEDIDEMYAGILERIRENNPYTDAARYWINVTSTDRNTRFCMGNRGVGGYNRGELFKILYRISQSGQDFVFQKFTLDVFLYDEGSASGRPLRRMDKTKAPVEKSDEESGRACTNIRNKGNNSRSFP